MSDAIKKLHDYLAKSPSVVYPEDVLAYLPAIEDENARLRSCLSDDAENARLIMGEAAELRELCADMWNWLAPTAVGGGAPLQGLYERMYKLGVEVTR